MERSTHIHIRATPDEVKQIQARAQAARMSMTRYVVSRALADEGESEPVQPAVASPSVPQERPVVLEESWTPKFDPETQYVDTEGIVRDFGY